jgi:hypothetical protein
MKEFKETLRRSLDAADYLIRAANTEDQALRGRLTSMAQSLLDDPESVVQKDPAASRQVALGSAHV